MNWTQMLTDLRQHQLLSREILSLAERESQALRQPSPGQPAVLQEISDLRRLLLPRLSESLEKVRRHREHWQTLTVAERAAQPEIAFLVRQTQDLIMRVLLLDRENEQGLLRLGLVPVREMNAVSGQRPQYVAGLYRRQAEA